MSFFIKPQVISPETSTLTGFVMPTLTGFGTPTLTGLGIPTRTGVTFDPHPPPTPRNIVLPRIPQNLEFRTIIMYKRTGYSVFVMSIFFL